MKVSILTEGGGKIGYGHVTRCMSVCQAFEEIGVPCEFVVNGDDSVRGLLAGKNCKMLNWLNDTRLLCELLGYTDILFIDSYLAGYRLYEKASLMVRTAVYFDDNIRMEYPRGIVLNGAIFAEQMPYPNREDIVYLLGTEFTPLRKDFWNVPERGAGEKIETVMITMGGADMNNFTPRLLRVLSEVCPRMHKKVIVTRSFGNTAEIEGCMDDYTDLVYCPNAAGMKQIMLESDIAITSCGQTLYELARMGVPAIGICVADNQLQNAEGWSRCGFLEYAGRYNDESIEQRIKDRLENLTDRAERERKAKTGRRMIDGRGCIRIIKAINADNGKMMISSVKSAGGGC